MKKIFSHKFPLNILLFALLPAFISIGIFFRWEALQSVYLNVWVTRDIDRSINLLEGNYFPLGGPETNVGGRLPGPMLYLLLLIAFLFKKSYESVFILNLFLNIGSLFGLFFIVKKYFGLQFSVIATFLLCINLPHIGGVVFPINPSFLYPFIVLFLWGLFEFVINKNPKAFPLIVLTIVLGIQIHYSMITYSLIPIALAIIFKIRIPKNIVLLCSAIIVICLIPFWVHKTQIFQDPNPIGNKFTFHFGSNPMWILVPFGGNIIYRMFFENGYHFNYLYGTFEATSYFLLTLGSLVVLLFKIIKVLKIKGSQNSNKEIIIFLLFYIPTLIYELSNPTEGHQWYWNIFIIPQTLIITYGFIFVVNSVSGKFKKIFPVIFFSLVFISLTIQAFFDINDSHNKIKRSFKIWSYKNTKIFYQTIMRELKIDPETYSKNVYYEGNYLKNNSERPPPSNYLIKFLRETPLPTNKYLFQKLNGGRGLGKTLTKKNQKPCFFIFDQSLAVKGTLTGFRISLFLNDTSIEKTDEFNLLFLDKNMSYRIIKYLPLLQQSCYSNTFNLFPVEPSTIQVLLKAKKFDLQNRDDMQVLEKKETYSLKGYLKNFNGQYLIYDEFTGSPFLFQLSVKSDKGNYKLKTKIINAYFFPFDRNITNMKIRILNDTDHQDTGIIRSNTLAGTFENYNREWEKETTLALKGGLKRNQFKFVLNWVSARANIEENAYRVYVPDAKQSGSHKREGTHIKLGGNSKINRNEMERYFIFTELTQKNTLRLY